MKSAARVKTYWYGAVGITGFGFGLIGDSRPLGEDLLAHPLVVYFFAIAVALMILRLAAQRPVPDIIPERALAAGCMAGLVLFLAGNFVAAHMLGR